MKGEKAFKWTNCPGAHLYTSIFLSDYSSFVLAFIIKKNAQFFTILDIRFIVVDTKKVISFSSIKFNCDRTEEKDLSTSYLLPFTFL